MLSHIVFPVGAGIETRYIKIKQSARSPYIISQKCMQAAIAAVSYKTQYFII
jgi:hypothetical protein